MTRSEPQHTLLTLGAMHSEGYGIYLGVRLSVCQSVCLLPRFLPPHATRQQNSDTNGFIATQASFL